MSGVSGLVQGSTRDLLQAILAHTQGLPALPATAFLALRLQYYDEVRICHWLIMGTILELHTRTLVHQPSICFRSQNCLFPPKHLK